MLCKKTDRNQSDIDKVPLLLFPFSFSLQYKAKSSHKNEQIIFHKKSQIHIFSLTAKLGFRICDLISAPLFQCEHFSYSCAGREKQLREREREG